MLVPEILHPLRDVFRSLSPFLSSCPCPCLFHPLWGGFAFRLVVPFETPVLGTLIQGGWHSGWRDVLRVYPSGRGSFVFLLTLFSSPASVWTRGLRPGPLLLILRLRDWLW